MRLSTTFLSIIALALGAMGAETAPQVQEGTGPVSPSTASYTDGPAPGGVNHNVSVAKVGSIKYPSRGDV